MPDVKRTVATSPARPLATATVIVLATLLAACNGGGGTLPSSGGTQTALQQVTFRINAPTPTTQSARRSPKYLSPATQSIAITVTPQSGCSTCSSAQTLAANLTLNGTNCTSTLATVTCVLTLQLAPGSYTASVNTYSGSLNASNQPTGSVLSQNQQVAFTVTAGQANTVALTLYGVPVSYALTVLSTQGGAVTASLTGGGYSLSFGAGTSSVTLLIEALDASGNAIVGLGAPQLSVTSSSTAVTVSSPSASAPNTLQMMVTPQRQPVNATVTVTAGYPAGSGVCSLAGAACSLTMNVEVPSGPLLAVGNQGNDTIALFALPLTTQSTPVQTITLPSSVTNGSSSAPAQPFGLAFGTDGTLYVSLVGSNVNTNTIAAEVVSYTPQSSGTYPTSPTATSAVLSCSSCYYPVPLAVSGSALYTLFVSPSSSVPNQLVAWSLPLQNGAQPAVLTSYGNNAEPSSLAATSSGTLYVAFFNGGSAGYVTWCTLPLCGGQTTGPTSLPYPATIATDASGDYFVLIQSTGVRNQILEYPPLSTTPVATISQGVTYSQPQSLAVDAAGNLYEATGSSLLIWAPPYTGTPTTISATSGNQLNQPYAVATYP
jgi:hypothetical protein